MNTVLPRAGDLLRIREARWRVVQCAAYPDAAIVDVQGSGRDNAGRRAQFLLPAELVEVLPASLEPAVVRPPRWRRHARTILAQTSAAHSALTTIVPAALSVLPFQLEPALAVTRGAAARLLIADAVGLGKTVQASLIVAEVLQRISGGRALIVCPAGLREQWQHELHTRFALAATVLDSASLAPAALDAAASPWSTCRIAIASIDYVKRPEVMRALEGLIWDVAVFDEAHALTGRSDRHTAAAALAGRSRTVVLLTATPHAGDDEAFARLAATGDIDSGFPLCVFRRTRLDAGLPSQRRTHWLRVRPTLPERRMHDALLAYTRRVCAASPAPGARLAMAVLTRRACSGAVPLARSLERRLALLGDGDSSRQLTFSFLAPGDDDEPVAHLATPGLHDRGQERRMLDAVLGLTRAAALHESKLHRLAALLRRARQPAIVFTEYRDTLLPLATALASHRPLLLHGGLSHSERRAIIRQFTGGDAGLLLATDAASEGLNLHERCRLVVNLELPWSPLRLEQRCGRVDRIGQPRRVHVLHLVARATAEETTVATLCRRHDRAESALQAIGNAALREDAVLQAIVDGRTLTPAPGRNAAPPTGDPGHAPAHAAERAGTYAVDLRDASIAEARAVDRARTLATGAVPPVARPLATVLERRGPAVAIWVYRLRFADRRGREVWQTLAGLRACPAAPLPRTPEALRRWLARMRPAFDDPARHEGTRQRLALARDLEPFHTLALRREHAILDALRHEQGRMAALLLQPGLFDQRRLRAASAQRRIADEAVARGQARLDELDGRRELTALEPELVLAVVIA